jgi:tetratricopeptide (TPR) repeat protein
MAQLDVLSSQLADLEAAHDLDGLRRTREQIVAEHPDSAAAVEALYKIGLDLLFRERKLDEAVARFDEAARRKTPFWSEAARVSLGLCLFHTRRAQKALLELRKVAYPEKPTAHSVTALAFIETIYETENKPDEVKRARKDRIAQLEQLTRPGPAVSAAERGHFLYLLGLACRDQGDDARAVKALEQARALGASVLGADLLRAVGEALR